MNLNNATCWYPTEETYLRFKAIVTDPETFALPYEEWVRRSNDFISEMAKKGVIIFKQNADPEEFLRWVKINSTKPDRAARMAYAVDKFSGKFGKG